MNFDLQIINALKITEGFGVFSDEDKKKIYNLSQNVNPELRVILLTILNSKSKEELDNAKISLMKYYEGFQKKSKRVVQDWVNAVYKEAEIEDRKQEMANQEKTLTNL